MTCHMSSNVKYVIKKNITYFVSFKNYVVSFTILDLAWILNLWFLLILYNVIRASNYYYGEG